MKIKFVENAKDWWKWASTQLVAIYSIVGAYFIAYPHKLEELTAFLPEGLPRWTGQVFIGVLLFSGFLAVRTTTLARPGTREPQ